jgi:hypothetical protein
MYVHYAIGTLGQKSSKKEVATIIFAGGFVSRGLIGTTLVKGGLATLCNTTRVNEGFITDCRGCRGFSYHVY